MKHWENNQSDLMTAMKAVAKDLGVKIVDASSIDAIAKKSNIRFRKVSLKTHWWKSDAGPLLGFSKKYQKPCALLLKSNQYFMIIPALNLKKPLSLNEANHLENTAYCFYRTFPNSPLNLKHILLFSTYKLRGEIGNYLMLEVFISLLGLLFPIMTGLILDSVIPNGDISLLTQFLLGLMVSIFAGTAFSLSQSFTLMRLRYKTNLTAQVALWDRLLRSPVNFFRKFTSGDLASRARGIDSIQQQMTSTIYSGILNGFFSVLILGLLFYYNVVLATLALILGLIGSAIIFFFNVAQLKYQRKLLEVKGKLSGLLFQLLTSISKIRVANSEKNAFLRWSTLFIEKNKLFIKSRTLSNYFSIIFSFFSTTITIIIYLAVFQQIHKLSFGDFIAFNAAFGQFFAAMLAMANCITDIILIIPLYERIKPILISIPETEHERGEIVLSGHIEIKNIKFSYEQKGIPLFEGLSLNIPAQKRIALVGQTGSGKSSIFRLLLKFETPEEGCILYDGQDLNTLNIQFLRRQLGVVLQTSTLLPGTIYENILGLESNLTIEDAFEAARIAEFADDIKHLPMGMHTLLMEGGRTFSAGQRQRLMLARALVRKPKILLLDEATSALDNKTQEHIHRNLSDLNITQVIAAHRLSTIRDADYIYVFENGKVIQRGSFDKLIIEHGLFCEMVNRQK